MKKLRVLAVLLSIGIAGCNRQLPPTAQYAPDDRWAVVLVDREDDAQVAITKLDSALIKVDALKDVRLWSKGHAEIEFLPGDGPRGRVGDGEWMAASLRYAFTPAKQPPVAQVTFRYGGDDFVCGIAERETAGLCRKAAVSSANESPAPKATVVRALIAALDSHEAYSRKPYDAVSRYLMTIRASWPQERHGCHFSFWST
jgi:hypothetical protein